MRSFEVAARIYTIVVSEPAPDSGMQESFDFVMISFCSCRIVFRQQCEK